MNQKSIRCQTKLETGKQCKKMSVPGFKFCRVHCFGHISNVPWYQNGLIQLAVALIIFIVSSLLAWSLFIKGPSAEKQNDILKIVQQMRIADFENSKELNEVFKLGYVLFTTAGRNEVVPLASPFDQMLMLDWSRAYQLHSDQNQITIRTPPIQYQPMHVSLPDGVPITLLRTPDYKSRPVGFASRGPHTPVDYYLTFIVLATNQDLTIVAMGLEKGP